MSVFLANEHLWGYNNIVDHVSDNVYLHLMREIMLVETLLAKAAWEKVLAHVGQTAKHYHADDD